MYNVIICLSDYIAAYAAIVKNPAAIQGVKLAAQQAAGYLTLGEAAKAKQVWLWPAACTNKGGLIKC